MIFDDLYVLAHKGFPFVLELNAISFFYLNNLLVMSCPDFNNQICRRNCELHSGVMINLVAIQLVIDFTQL